MKVILNADDFGRSHERNLAIDYAMRNGLIASAALMVNSDYTKEAIEFAKSGGYLDKLHCHLSLAYGETFSGNSKPLNEDFANCETFCENKEFRHPFYNKLNFYEYTDVTFKELEAQYQRFIYLTDGKGNRNHLDVHIYNNRSFPFACAYRRLIDKYDITSARYYAVHHRTQKNTTYEKYRLIISAALCGHSAKVCKSDNIDYFLTKREEFIDDIIVELYCHPDYKDDVLLDNSESIFGHKRMPLEVNINAVKEKSIADFISWKDVDELIRAGKLKKLYRI